MLFECYSFSSIFVGIIITFMRIELDNIGKIKKGSIELNGLTVIAGSNDSGKSTVGKTLYSIVKAVKNVLGYDKMSKQERLKELTYELSRRIGVRSVINRVNLGLFEKDGIGKYTPEYLYDVLISSEDIEYRLNCISLEILSFEYTPRQRQLIQKSLDKIRELFSISGDKNMILKSEINSFIESEFYNSFTRLGSNMSRVLFDSDNGVSEVELSDGKVNRCVFDIVDSLEDITYIDSPIYLQLQDVLARAVTYSQMKYKNPFLYPMVQYHIKDMADKLSSFKYIQSNSVIQEIIEITGGVFKYDKANEGFVWVKDNVKYSMANIASGIKSFGVIQMLMDTNNIGENKMLIWDEPENHLHPEWQIQFAHLLVKLANKGIPIVVSSHSPYFIQSIRHFARLEKSEPYVNYYLMDDSDDSCYVVDVTDDLNKIFSKLALPMTQIMNMPFNK